MRAILALFVRSLRVDARSWKTYAARGGLVLFTFMMLLSVHVNARTYAAPGLMLFTFIIWIDAIFLLLISFSYFGSAIAEEKEDRTLPLLRMTTLSPLSILLGKGGGRLLGVLFVVLAQLPFTLLAVALGGVATVQIYAAYAALFGLVCLTGAIGLLASVACRTSREASSVAGLLCFLFYLGPWIVSGIIHWMVNVDWLAPGNQTIGVALTDLANTQSAFAQLGTIQATGFAGPIWSTQVTGNLIVALALFGLSWLGFDRLTRRERTIVGRGLLARGGAGNKQRAFGSTGAVWSNPLTLAWKDYNFVAGGTTWLIGKFLVYAALLLGIGIVTETRDSQVGAMILAVTIPLGILEVAFVASRVYSLEVREQTLPVLLLLPISLSSWAYSKLAGAMLSVIPALLWLVIGFLFWDYNERWLEEMLRDSDNMLALAVTMMYLMTYWHLVGLISLYQRAAIVLAGLVMMFGTMAYWLGLAILMSLFLPFGSGGSEMIYLLIFASLGLMATICLGCHLTGGRRLQYLATK